MKGLLLKDWYMILKYCRAFLVILVIFMGVSAVSESALFFALYPMILVTMVPVTLMSYEEKSGWNIYCDTMPSTRKKSGKLQIYPPVAFSGRLPSSDGPFSVDAYGIHKWNEL